MKDDPIVAEVRRIRHEHAARFKYDLDLIVKDLKAQEQASGRSYIAACHRVVWPFSRRGHRRRPASGETGGGMLDQRPLPWVCNR